MRLGKAARLPRFGQWGDWRWLCVRVPPPETYVRNDCEKAASEKNSPRLGVSLPAGNGATCSALRADNLSWPVHFRVAAVQPRGWQQVILAKPLVPERFPFGVLKVATGFALGFTRRGFLRATRGGAQQAKQQHKYQVAKHDSFSLAGRKA